MEDEGFEILARNWRGGGGEIDLIALRGGRLRFVEVKARPWRARHGLEAVGVNKRARLRQAAEAWLVTEGAALALEELAFLVVEVEVGPDGSFRPTFVDDAF